MTETVLILGPRGRFGRHACAAFAAEGWTVRTLARPAAPGAPARPATPGVETRTGDAHDPDAVIAAAQGCSVIVNALNAPYPRWSLTLPRETNACIAAARATGATVILAGNVYPYGSTMPELLTEATPFRPDTRKGRLRAAQEAAYRDAAGFGVRTILLRGGDFLDTEIAGNWFDSHVSAPAAKGQARYPGPLDLPHAWAFLPDFARACAGLAARRDALPAWAPLGFPGDAPTGTALIAAMSKAAGRDLAPTPMPWWALRLLSPVWPMAREITEMRYLWRVPHRIDGAGLAEALPGFRPTPFEATVAAAMAPRLAPQTVQAAA